MVGQSCVLRYISPFVGFTAPLPQFDPPRAPGSEIVSVSPGGVKSPSLRMPAILSFQEARSSGVRIYGLTSSAVIFWRAKGGGAVGNGCVGHACSPGIKLLGTDRSSIGHKGLPVTRSNTYRNPCLLDCATTSTRFPSCITVSNCGAAVLS